MCSKIATIRQCVSAPPSPKSTSSSSSCCASGHILLVSMQKLRNPAFQRFGADLRKTLMITSVVKQARKFYQLGSDVPVNCACVRADSMFVLPMSSHDYNEDTVQPVVEEEDEEVVETGGSVPTSVERQSRKHSLSPFRKNRGPKVSCIVPVECNKNHDATPVIGVHSHHRHHRHHHSSGNSHLHSNDHEIDSSLSPQQPEEEQLIDSNSHNNTPLQRDDQQNSHQSSQSRLHIAVARYLQFHQTSDDTPPIKKRRLAAFLPYEPNAICITATVC